AEALTCSFEFTASSTAFAHSSLRNLTPISSSFWLSRVRLLRAGGGRNARPSGSGAPGSIPIRRLGLLWRFAWVAVGIGALRVVANPGRRGEDRRVGEMTDVVQESHGALVSFDLHRVDRRVVRQEEHVVRDVHHVAEVRID